MNKGNILLGNPKALVFDEGAPSGHRSLTFRAPLDAANRALASIQFESPSSTWSGSDLLSVSVDDGGHAGLGGPIVDAGTVPIFVGVNSLQATNLPPSITAPKSLENAAGCSIRLSGALVLAGLARLCH